MRVLVVNAGSSSLKLRVLEADDTISGSLDLPMAGDQADVTAVAQAVHGFGTVDAVGHRIVHGGIRFREPVVVDAAVIRQLHALTDLAPLHQPKSLAALAVVDSVLPDVPAVACFDTAFHADMPEAASTYALPREWRERWELRRYGFHGLSHAYAASRAAELLERPVGELRTVTCHLGAGASLAAVRGGRSVDTTMGFTPLEGLVMATRSGSVDPGLVLWLVEHVGMPPAELAATLEHRSGLLGLAGSPDMRTILAAEAAGDPDARLAVAAYLHRLRGSIAAMAAAMDGLEVLVFTGGVGERAPSLRARAAAGLSFLGVALDDAANEGPDGDRDISAGQAVVRTFVVLAREDVWIARQVRGALASGSEGVRAPGPS